MLTFFCMESITKHAIMLLPYRKTEEKGIIFHAF